MAEMEAAIVALLAGDSVVSGMVANRIHPDLLPQGILYPAIRYQRISTQRVEYRLMDTGKALYARPRIQIDCWALTRGEALALAAAVRGVLGGFRGISAGLEIVVPDPEDEGSSAEPDIGPGGATVYGERLDFLIGHRGDG